MNKLIQCSQCKELHPISDTELIFRRPDAYVDLGGIIGPGTQADDDLCKINDERFFIRGLLPLSVEGRERAYRIGIWAEISEDDFYTSLELWDTNDNDAHPSFRGKLANDISDVYSETTIDLPVLIQLQNTQRPIFTLQEINHPLVIDQRKGVTEHRIAQFQALYS